MAKEWILNIATNRWGLNKTKSVGPVALWIRECAPKNIQDWQRFYLKKLAEHLRQQDINLNPEEYITTLGQKLFIKVSETLSSEIEEVTEEDCVQYIKNLLIKRTFEGYHNEIKTIYGYLENVLGEKIQPAPDKWDKLYNVDFYIKRGDKIIGLQIKPITYDQLPEIHKWRKWLERTHEKFKNEQGGDVFILFTTTKDRKKIIHNHEIIKEIKQILA